MKINIWVRKQTGYWKGGWFRKLLAATIGIGLILGMFGQGRAAEPTFVGILAFLDDPEVAKQLELSAEQQEKLTALLEAREAEALELALQLKNLSPGQRAERLLPFRQESERRGLALLSPAQQKKLQQIRLQRLGLASLGEEDVAGAIGLSAEQKAEVAKILREREDRLAVTSKDRAHIVRAETERQLAQLLSAEQKARWESLLSGAEPQTGQPGGASGSPRPEGPGASPLPPASQAASAEPAKPESGSNKMAVEPIPTEASGKPELPNPGAVSQPSELPKPVELSKPETPAKTETMPAELPPPDVAKPESAKPEAGLPGAMPSGPAKPEVGPAPLGPSTPTKPEIGTSPAGPSTSSKPEAGRPESTPGVPPSAASETAQMVPLDQVKLRFNFRYQPWKDVLEWFAQQAGLSLIMDDPPKGTFNYTDDKAYTPAEAIDLLNGVLQTKGYVLVRRNRMLMVINLENGIPPLLIETIPAEELERRGVYEVVSVAFQLQKLAPEEIEGEVQKMIGPQGSVISLPKSRQLLVTETVGRLRAIRRAIERAEDPEGVHRQQQLRQVALQYASPKDVLPVLRQFLDIPADQAASPDGAIRVIPDPTGKGLLVSGKEEKISRLMEVLKFLDTPENAAKPELDQTPQLEAYSVAPADPNSVLAVIQTLLAGSPDARVAIDPKTGNLIALCKPSEHATIKATLEQLQADPRKIEVIPLSKVDPQSAAASLKKLFGVGETPDPNKPQIEVDTTAKQLLVRATPSQLEQIKLLLEKMGELGEAGAEASRGGNVRMIPITGRAAQDVLDRALEIWPTMHRNRIRVVRPSAVIPTMRPSSSEQEKPSGATSTPSTTPSPSGAAPADTPEQFWEHLFGPLGGGTPSGEPSSGPMRTRIIRPPAGPSPAGSPPGPLTPGGGPNGGIPKPPFPPGLDPGTPPGAAGSGHGAWRPAGTPPAGTVGTPAMPGGAVGNPPLPGTGPSKPESNPPGSIEKPAPEETPPPSLPKPTGEKTAGRWPPSIHRIKAPILLAAYSRSSEASEEESAGESSSAPTRQTPSRPKQATAPSPSEKPITEQSSRKPSDSPTTETGPMVSPPLSGSPMVEPSPTGSTTSSGQSLSSSASAPKSTESASSSAPGSSRSAEEPPVIVVSPGPGGIMIASEDLDALDAFENLLNNLASNLPESNVTVFYLKYAKAEAAADLLERIFGASSSGGGAPLGGGRGLLGDIAGAALGDAGGGILGTLLGLGGPGGPPGGITPTGTIQITPDPRLNALIVQANTKDTEMIEELLKILDQEKGPEPIAVQPKARVIPVVNTAAEDIAELVREVYSDRLIGGGAAGQRPPTPQEFIQMLRGGGGGGRRGAGGGSQVDIQQKMAIGVDSRNNSLIVVAPDQLFQEVEQLVKQLDAAAAESNQTIRVVNLRNANPAAVQQALSALMGSNVQFGRTGTTSRSRQQQPQTGQQPGAQMQPPFMMPGAQGVPGFGQFRQFQGQFGAPGAAPFQGGATGRQGRFNRSGRQ